MLYSNFDSVFDDLETDDDKFYEMAYKKQKELIKVKVDEIIAEISDVSGDGLQLRAV